MRRRLNKRQRTDIDTLVRQLEKLLPKAQRLHAEAADNSYKAGEQDDDYSLDYWSEIEDDADALEWSLRKCIDRARNLKYTPAQ